MSSSSSSWTILGLAILVLLQVFVHTTAQPVGSGEHYSVEEQDLGEQTVEETVHAEKDSTDDKPIYELQLAIWPEGEEDEQMVPHHVMSDNANAPVYEEQEIAYPVLTPQQEDDVHVVQNVPTWHHTTTTTKRPTMQEIPVVWQESSQPASPPVHVQPTWQHVVPTTTTERPTMQEIPVVWQQPSQPASPPVHVQPTWQHVVPTTVRPMAPEVPSWHNPQNNAGVPVSVVPSNSVPVQAPAQNEQPVQIFPDIHFDEPEAIADQQDNVDVLHDPLLISSIQDILSKPKPTKRPVPQVEVVEQYQVVNPNGTTEYKLVLSNGMTNYKKIYNKLLPNGKVVTVQKGYDSVPIPGDDPYSNDYQTQYYIADEFGHNVYKLEKHTRRPKFPSHLDYKEQAGQF